MGRTPCCDKASVNRGTWSPAEDDVLRKYIQKHGRVDNWISLPRKAGFIFRNMAEHGLNRCGKSCRLRWLNYLRPEIKRGSFSEDEENLIFSLYNEFGSRWSAIASQLPGRTDNEVKNLWNTKLKKKLVASETTFVNGGKTATSEADQSSLRFLMSSSFGENNDLQAVINPSEIYELKPLIASDLQSVSSSMEAASSFCTTSSSLPPHQKLSQWSINGGDDEEDDVFLSSVFQRLHSYDELQF